MTATKQQQPKNQWTNAFCNIIIYGYVNVLFFSEEKLKSGLYQSINPNQTNTHGWYMLVSLLWMHQSSLQARTIEYCCKE